jgi:hypothetical protein
MKLKKGKLIGSMKLSGEIYSIEWDATGTHLAAAVGNFGVSSVIYDFSH